MTDRHIQPDYVWKAVYDPTVQLVPSGVPIGVN
jgi:hypothetical protein